MKNMHFEEYYFTTQVSKENLFKLRGQFKKQEFREIRKRKDVTNKGNKSKTSSLLFERLANDEVQSRV